MRKIVAGLFLSLDGVADADAASAHRWMNPEMEARMAAGIAEADAILIGFATYRMFAEIWKPQGESSPMAKFLNTTPKYVASQDNQPLDWQPATLLTGDLKSALTSLKSQPGKNIQIPGSPLLVRGLLAEGLPDELYLNICPVIAGPGLHLFEGIDHQVDLTLTEATTYANGVVGLSYRLSPKS